MSFAYEADLVSQAFVADTDLSTKQYYAMKMLSTEKIALASDAGDFLFGVLQDAPTAKGQTCLVAMEGITKAVGGAAINAGAKVEVGAGGKFVTYTGGPLAGIATNACGGVNQLFSLKICRDSS
jgi:hypothetical protein